MEGCATREWKGWDPSTEWKSELELTSSRIKLLRVWLRYGF